MLILTDVDNKIKVKNVPDLLNLPFIVKVNKFDEASSKQFLEDMNIAANQNFGIIPILIDSYGGQVYSLLNMIDVIKKCKLPVATIVMGKAMSCGAVLATCGTEGYRFCSPHSTVMIHDVSSMEFGKNEEIKAGAKEVDRLNDLIYKIMAENCGKEEKYFWDIVQSKGRADWYITPTEAKEHGIANHIRIPDFKVKVEVKVKFE